MVLVLLKSELYIASVMFIESKQKKVIVHDVLAVIMMSICETCIKSKNLKIKKKEKKEKKKKFVDALIVHVVRLVCLTSTSDCLTDVWTGGPERLRKDLSEKT